MPLPAPSLKARALRLLSGREYSRAELERKLQSHEPSPGALAKTLDELEAKGFISEQRVVESLLHRRSAKLGAARIQQELLAKGVAPAAVKQAVQALQSSEIERARAVWSRRFGAGTAVGDESARARSPPPAERARQMRFLAARGFGAETIRRVVSENPRDREAVE